MPPPGYRAFCEVILAEDDKSLGEILSNKPAEEAPEPVPAEEPAVEPAAAEEPVETPEVEKTGDPTEEQLQTL